MGWLKRRKQQERLPGKSGGPYALPDNGKLSELNLQIVVNEPPEIQYNMGIDRPRMYGGFELNFMGKVKRAEKTAVFQDDSCSITINGYTGALKESNESRGVLGYLRLESDEERVGAKFLQVELDVDDRFASDIVKLITDLKPVEESILRIGLVLQNERRLDESPRGYPLKEGHRIITYEVVRFFLMYDTEELEVEPWQPDGS